MPTKVTHEVLADDAVEQNNVADAAIGTAELIDDSVTNAKLADDAVGTAQIADDAVTNAKIGAGAVGTTELADDAVTNAKIGAGAVGTTELADDAVEAAKLATDSVTADAIAAGAVGTDELAAEAVTTAKIAAGAVGTNEMSVSPVLQGKHSIWIPARAFWSSATNGATVSTLSYGAANKPTQPVMAFSNSVTQGAEFDIAMPKSWDGGSLDFYVYWTHPTTATNFGVNWDIGKIHFSEGDSYNTTYGNQANTDDTGGVADTQYRSPVITIATSGSPATDDLTFFQLRRNTAAGGDTLAVEARVLGVLIKYTVSATNDA